MSDIARELNLRYRTVYDWCVGRMANGEKPRFHRCPRCAPGSGLSDPAAHAYLLGQYLGDGHLGQARQPYT